MIKSKRFKKLLCLLTATVITASLVGCGKSTPKDGETTDNGGDDIEVSVVLKALNSDYWKIVEAGAKAAATELGVKVNVLGPNAETDIAGQTSLMEDQIVKGVDALVVAPSQPSAAVTIFDKADEAKIPVFLIDTNADWDKKVSFIGTGNLIGGELGGNFIADKLKAGDEVAIIRGALGDNTHDQRVKGAQEAMEAKGLKVISVQPADSDRNKGMSVMENILQTNPNVKAVYCSNDEMALGASRALQQAGKKDVITVGFDGSPDALKAIQNGELTASVAQSAYNIGKYGVEAAVKHIKGEKVESVIDTGTEIIDTKNAKAKEDETNKMLGK
ncbi:sugar ABC transporter substrate-binding protein [Clostridium sp.]|uniref:sugar ABC transporter substrate-binding protein n=1 Tax=Clostridium sp. TaxID=1506 RepID=UPI003216D715